MPPSDPEWTRTPTEPPMPETEHPQPDPFLGPRPIGAVALTCIALVVAAIIGVTLWGLNGPEQARHAAAVSSTTHDKKPAAGGKSGAATPGAPRTTRSGSG